MLPTHSIAFSYKRRCPDNQIHSVQPINISKKLKLWRFAANVLPIKIYFQIICLHFIRIISYCGIYYIYHIRACYYIQLINYSFCKGQLGFTLRKPILRHAQNEGAIYSCSNIGIRNDSGHSFP